MYECPNCGKLIEEDKCECGFNVNETLSCPYRISNKCIHESKECDVYGLDYELCDIYLHKTGISTKKRNDL